MIWVRLKVTHFSNFMTAGTNLKRAHCLKGLIRLIPTTAAGKLTGIGNGANYPIFKLAGLARS